MSQTSETVITQAVLRIAARSPNGIASFDLLYQEIPKEINLSAADRIPSTTRPGEEMWQQIERNIQSHHETEGNAIAEGWLVHVPQVGYQITDAGAKLV